MSGGTRPRRRPDGWADSEVYNYGSAVYDGEISVVEVPDGPVNDGSAERYNGFKPAQGIAVDVLNERFNTLGKWITYFEEGEFRNWQYLQNLAAGSPAATKGNAIAWCAQHAEGSTPQVVGQWVVIGYDASVSGALVSTDGKTWTNNGPISGGDTSDAVDLDCRPESNQIVAVALSGRYFRRNTSEVWSDSSIAGQTILTTVRWASTFSLWLMGTRQSVDTKAKVCTSSDGSAWTERTLPGANTTTAIKWIASGNGCGIAIDDGATPKQWYSTNGTSWTEYSGFSAAITGAIRGLVYNAALGTFFLVTASKVYSSANGQSWTLVSTHGFTPINRSSGLCAHGRALVTADSDANTIVYSLDGGVTWKHAPFAQTGAKQAITGVASNGRQLAVVAYRAANTADVAVGLSLGSP